MFNQSIIRSSGQWWKVVISFCSVVIGGLSLLLGLHTLRGNNSNLVIFLILFGILLGLSGIAFAIFAIRCRNCGARWVWLALSKQKYNQWLFWLLSQSKCPTCGKK